MQLRALLVLSFFLAIFRFMYANSPERKRLKKFKVAFRIAMIIALNFNNVSNSSATDFSKFLGSLQSILPNSTRASTTNSFVAPRLGAPASKLSITPYKYKASAQPVP